MAREATCPACEGRVPVPKGTQYNTPVRCPMCDEAFVPPWLRVSVVDEDGVAFDRYLHEICFGYWSARQAEPGAADVTMNVNPRL